MYSLHAEGLEPPPPPPPPLPPPPQSRENPRIRARLFQQYFFNPNFSCFMLL